MSAQKPMSARMGEMLIRLEQYDGLRVDILDRRVLNRLIKKGLAKIENTGGPKEKSWYSSTSTRSVAKSTRPLLPITEDVGTGGPGAKRRAALEESGLSYRGKTWGKVRVDLPREEREKRMSDKKNVWKKLKSWRTQ